MWGKVGWAVLSDEQMSNGYPFSLLNDEQMSNKVRVEHQPVGHGWTPFSNIKHPVIFFHGIPALMKFQWGSLMVFA